MSGSLQPFPAPFEEIKLRIDRIPLGTGLPFLKGGSGDTMAVTIPAKAVRKLGLREKIGKEISGYIFHSFDLGKRGKGFLLVPVGPDYSIQVLKDALKFVDISDLSDEDLKVLLKPEE